VVEIGFKYTRIRSLSESFQFQPIILEIDVETLKFRHFAKSISQMWKVRGSQAF